MPCQQWKHSKGISEQKERHRCETAEFRNVVRKLIRIWNADDDT